MKRRLTIARVAGQRPRAAAARRADHRARPAGPPPAVGAALPAQARGRHPDHHHALHGRGRAAVRPAGRHGRRGDRRRGLAGRADRALLHPGGAGAALRARATRPRPTAGWSRWPSGWRSCPTGCCSTPPTASTRRPAGRGRAPAAVRAGAPLVAGGRVPPAHRPDAGRLMAAETAATVRSTGRAPARAAACCWSSSTTGPGTGATGGPPPCPRSLQPLLFLLAFGVGFGSLVDGAGRAAEATGGVDYLVWLAPGAAGGVGGAERRVRLHLPGAVGVQVAAHLPRDDGRPDHPGPGRARAPALAGGQVRRAPARSTSR